ncbi:MAG: hypothetical protein HGB02_08480 [Chlorobiaceae bacterium]|nr:hypothetical protein [Chlorobiaceae bacterium]
MITEQETENDALVAENDRLKARIEEIEKPRAMKPYSEECRPEKEGFYWYFSTEYRDVFEPFPAYYDGDDRWFQDDGGHEDLEAATHWLELEAPPVLPEGGVK